MNIFTACMTGNLAWLKQQKAAGQLPDLRQYDGRYWCPHVYAAENGHLDVLKWVVQDSGLRLDVTVRDNDAVRWAARNGHLDVVKWLVQDYSDWLTVKKLEDPSFTGQFVDVTADDNWAVRWAAANGHLEVLKWLVQESGQSVEVINSVNDTLRFAAQNGHQAVVDYLNFVTPLIQAVGLEAFRTGSLKMPKTQTTAQKL